MSFVYGVELAASANATQLLDELDDAGADIDNEYGGVTIIGDSGVIVGDDTIEDYQFESVAELYPLGMIDEADNTYRIADEATHLFDEDEYDLDGHTILNPKAGIELNFG